MKSVFISYSTNDKDIAAKVKAALLARGVKVTIDSESLGPGRDIRAFIDKSIRETDVTLSIVSRNSLLSDWVALETVDSVMAERLLDQKQFIPCFIDEEFRRNECLTEATRLIDEKIANIDQEITMALSLRTDLTDLQAIRNRKLDLRHNLSKILNDLREKLTLDIREPLFDENMRKIINAIDPEAGRYPHHTYLNWLRKEQVKSELKYTKLSGRTQRKPEPRNPFRPQSGEETGIAGMLASEARPDLSEPFEDAVTEILTLRRAALLGDPGSGKSTTLWKLAGQLCDDSFRDPEAPLPVLVRLGFWTSAEEPLTDFITLQSGPLPAPIDQLLGEKRVAILLDGMNEIPTGQWKAKYEEIREFVTVHQDLIVVVACRELDYTVDLGLSRIVIQPLDPIRIRHFIDDYLGAERGESLFWGLVGFDHTNRLFCDYCGGKCDCDYTYPTIGIGSVQKYHRDFISQLGVRPEDAEQFFWLKQEAPEDNERVRMDVSNGWSRWITLRDNPASLLALSRNPFLLKTICHIYETTNTIPENTARFIDLLVRALIQREINSKRVLPDEIEPFLDVLSQLAYGIKTSSERQASMMVDDGQGLTTERLLELASSASLLDVNDRIRFAHPLLQEYFTAIGLEKEIRRGVFNATEIWPLESWWQRTKWDMATLLLAGLQTDDCSEVVDWVAAANPEVAAECIVLSGAALALPTTERLHREWQARLGDPARDPDPYARAAVGRALGLTRWDNRDGIGTKKVEIDGQTIVLPDFERAWIEIPAGQFIYGPSIEHDLRKGGYIESPPWEVTLPSFRISRYPVTFAQFQTFIDDPDGYQDQERWFGGLTRNEQDRRVQDQFFRVGGKPSYNEPRETVNWYQAVAFCRWLSWRLGGSYDLKEINQWIVRLPTEVEWERAARGLDGRIYPYGNEFNSAKGNTWETRLACTTAVGIFPEGASPDGLLDMCGNVREWCLGCDFKSNGDRATIARMKKGRQPQRGGSFDDLKDWSRVFYRSDCIACESDCEVGFRVVSVVRHLS